MGARRAGRGARVRVPSRVPSRRRLGTRPRLGRVSSRGCFRFRASRLRLDRLRLTHRTHGRLRLSQPDFGRRAMNRADSVSSPETARLAESRSRRGSTEGADASVRLRTSRAARAATGVQLVVRPDVRVRGSRSTRAGAGALARRGGRPGGRRRGPSRGRSGRRRVADGTPRGCRLLAPAGRRWRRPWRPRAWRRAPTRARSRTPSAPERARRPYRPRPLAPRPPRAESGRVASPVLGQNAPPREKRATPRAGPRSTRTRDARLATRYRLDARKTRGRLLSRLDPRGSSLASASPPQLNYGTGGGDPT